MLPDTLWKLISSEWVFDIPMDDYTLSYHVSYLPIFQVAEESNRNIKARDHHHAGVQHSIPTLM